MATLKTRGKTNPDEAKVKQIRDRFADAFQKWDAIYKDGDKNMKYIAGDPWEPGDRKMREDAGRPVVTFDELGQYLNQGVNEVRANPRAAKFSPTGDGATDDTARFYAELMRETEYRSNAQIAYTTAYENSLQRGFGFVRLVAEYEHERSHVQQLRIKAIPNPACCYPDPDGMEPDGSDWKYFFYVESYNKAEFERAFPDAAWTDFSQEQITQVGSNWLGKDKIQVAEYWEVETEDYDLIELELPATKTRPASTVTYIAGVDPKPRARGGRIVQTRKTEVQTVCSYLTNGVELLAKGGEKKQAWAGKYIPFASCYGKIVWLNQGSGPERKILAMTTLAREPFMAYCFTATCELEAIGTITKNPYWAYEGSLDAKQMNEIAKSIHEPVSVLLSKPKIEGLPGVLIPLPVRNPMSIDLSAYAIARENSRRAIQAAMGWTPLPTQAQRQNEKSGVALKQIEESGQRGSYHFIDHYNDLIRRVGVMFEELVDKLYDTEDREVITTGADKATRKYRINHQPQAQEQVQEGVEDLPSTKGRHAVTVDVGPEFASEREASAEFLDTFVASATFAALEPAKRDKLIGLAIKERVLGPMGEKMADVISPVTKPGEGPDPQQAVALLQQAQQQIIPALEATIQDLQQKLDAKMVESQSREKIAAQTDATKREIAVLQHKAQQTDTTVEAETAVEIQTMRDAIERMWLKLEAMKIGAELAQQRDVEGAKLEQSTAMGEQGRESASSEAAEDRKHASGEAHEARAHEAGEAKEDRALTAEQMKAKSKEKSDAK